LGDQGDGNGDGSADKDPDIRDHHHKGGQHAVKDGILDAKQDQPDTVQHANDAIHIKIRPYVPEVGEDALLQDQPDLWSGQIPRDLLRKSHKDTSVVQEQRGVYRYHDQRYSRADRCVEDGSKEGPEVVARVGNGLIDPSRLGIAWQFIFLFDPLLEAITYPGK